MNDKQVMYSICYALKPNDVMFHGDHGQWQFRKQRGQALTEFLIWSIALIPLLLLTLLIGKYADMNQTAIQASRYIAWERAATTTAMNSKSDAQLADEVRSRIFANTGRSIKSSDSVNDATTDDHNEFLRDHSGNRLIAAFEDIAVKTNQSEMVLGSKGKVLSAFNTSYFQLPTNNLWRGDITVAVANTPLLGKWNLKISRYNVILTDAWDAGSQENEIAFLKKSPVMTSSPLIKALPLDGATKSLMNTVEPAFKDFELGRIGPNPLPVPKDRL